jgi:accessory gene regulator B
LNKKLADSIAITLVESGGTQHSPAVLSYGLQIIINTIIKIAVITLIGWSLHILLELYIMIFAFGSLRMITGGVHAHTFFKCLTISLISFVMLTLSVPYVLPLFLNYSLGFLTMILLFGSAVTYLYVPGKWGKRHFTEKRIRVSKYLSFLYLSIVLLSMYYASTLVYASRLQQVLLIAILGMIWQYVLVTPLGYRLFNTLENIMNLKRR